MAGASDCKIIGPRFPVVVIDIIANPCLQLIPFRYGSGGDPVTLFEPNPFGRLYPLREGITSHNLDGRPRCDFALYNELTLYV